MARRNVPFLPGLYYHIYNRGASRGDIFCDEHDYLLLLRQIQAHAGLFEVSVIAYCLMPNHYHLLLRQDGKIQISEFMQAVFYVYSRAFNEAHEHSGTVFEGPFRAILVDKTEYLIHLCRYIHRNPVDAGLVGHPDQWDYSNYLEFIEKRNGKLVDREFVRTNFGTPLEYEDFVVNYVPSQNKQRVLRHYLFV